VAVSTPVKVGIVLGVAAVWLIFWWSFESAPPGSRRKAFDQKVRLWGERRMARRRTVGRWRLPSTGFMVVQLLVLVALIWLALR
jgi:hypothetical protein